MSKFAEKAVYQRKTTRKNESQLEMIQALELSADAHRKLLAHCRRRSILFLSSIFDESSADLLEELDAPMFKIPSPELINIDLLRHVARKQRPIMLSTGMATLGEVDRAVTEIRSISRSPLVLLHCVTEYPAPYREINLRAMSTLAHSFHELVGYSDHTPGIELPIAAAALGAAVIEKHFTLDRRLPGPDHKASLEPAELRSMVLGIRHVEAALGDGIKRPADCEKKNIPIARKSVVAARRIRKGQRITRRDVTLKRPGTGIPPMERDKVIGKRAQRTLEVDHVICWTDIGC